MYSGKLDYPKLVLKRIDDRPLKSRRKVKIPSVTLEKIEIPKSIWTYYQQRYGIIVMKTSWKDQPIKANNPIAEVWRPWIQNPNKALTESKEAWRPWAQSEVESPEDQVNPSTWRPWDKID